MTHNWTGLWKSCLARLALGDDAKRRREIQT
jgi:hypothetical protein